MKKISIILVTVFLMAGLIFSCDSEDWDDPKPTNLSKFMDGNLSTLTVPQFQSADEGQVEYIANAIKTYVVNESNNQASNSPDLDTDDKDWFEEKFVRKILHLSLDDKFKPGSKDPDKCKVTISAFDMRDLTGYDWALEKTIQLSISFQ